MRLLGPELLLLVPDGKQRDAHAGGPHAQDPSGNLALAVGHVLEVQVVGACTGRGWEGVAMCKAESMVSARVWLGAAEWGGAGGCERWR